MELTDTDAQWARVVIEKSGFFEGCSAEELNRIAEGFEKRHYAAGETIMFQGEISNKLYIVQCGKASVVVRKRKRQEKVAELGPLDFLGEISLFTPRAATATVKAETDCEVIVLPGEAVEKVVKDNAPLAEKILKKIEERLKVQERVCNPDEDIVPEKGASEAAPKAPVSDESED